MSDGAFCIEVAVFLVFSLLGMVVTRHSGIVSGLEDSWRGIYRDICMWAGRSGGIVAEVSAVCLKRDICF